MFRNSDYVPPTLHPTYAKKPLSEFQLRSQVAEFDDGGRKKAIEAAAQVVPEVPVPATHDTVYQPDHPDADWGGFVDKKFRARKHVGGNPGHQSHLIQTEQGIIGNDGKSEYSRVTRIDWGHNEDEGVPLIGGPALPDQYKSVYKSQTLGEGTSRDQLSLMKRTMKPVPTHPVEDKKPHRAAVNFKESFSEQPKYSDRGPTGTRSLVSDLGDSLAHICPDPPPVRRKAKN